uniref:Uncharacterized protein n=1 Tax=Arundo donax TaxID=35708 RepID=A0A0A8YHY5_ARUDO
MMFQTFHITYCKLTLDSQFFYSHEVEVHDMSNDLGAPSQLHHVISSICFFI